MLLIEFTSLSMSLSVSLILKAYGPNPFHNNTANHAKNTTHRSLRKTSSIEYQLRQGRRTLFLFLSFHFSLRSFFRPSFPILLSSFQRCVDVYEGGRRQ
jgi:hypothetical protein